MKRSKAYLKAAEQIDLDELYSPLAAVRIAKGSGEPHKVKAGSITKDQVRQIAETKMPDLNANDVEAAMKIIEGTARQMGITVSA